MHGSSTDPSPLWKHDSFQKSSPDLPAARKGRPHPAQGNIDNNDDAFEGIDDLIRHYENGETIAGLTQQNHHLSYRKVRTLLLDAGVTLRPPKIPLPPAPPGLANAYRDGLSIRNLAKKHGMSYNQTRRVLLALGVELRPRGRAP